MVSGSWNRQPESIGREFFCCNDTDRTHTMMMQGFLALKSGEWEEYESTFRNEAKVSEWAFDNKGSFREGGKG